MEHGAGEPVATFATIELKVAYLDASWTAPRASASEAGRADRSDPAAYLCGVLLVHVEKVGHRGTD